MRKSPVPFLIIVLASCALAAVAQAGGPRTLRVQMYNSSSVAKSQCFVLGVKPNSPYRRTLTTFTHTRRNGSKVYTYDVPSQYSRVDVMCKANGPTATNKIELARFPLDRYWVKASCPSSQPDAKCTVNQYGGDPEY